MNTTSAKLSFPFHFSLGLAQLETCLSLPFSLPPFFQISSGDAVCDILSTCILLMLFAFTQNFVSIKNTLKWPCKSSAFKKAKEEYFHYSPTFVQLTKSPIFAKV